MHPDDSGAREVPGLSPFPRNRGPQSPSGPRPPAWRPPEPLPLPLATGRAVLDVLQDADAPALHRAVAASREVLGPWLPWAATGHRDEAESLAWIRALARQRGFAHPDAYHLALFDDDRPRDVLGGVGFVRIEAARLEAEVGYWLRVDRQGRGLCTEAVGRLLTSAFADWGFRRVVIGCHGANRASQRVAERLGLRHEVTARAARWQDGRGWCDHVGYAVLAEEWDGSRHRGPAV